VPHPTLPSAQVPSVHVPSVHQPSVHVPRPPVPHASGQDVTTAARVVGSYLPPREQLVLYAGMGAGAVAGVIEWPVAAAVAAGTFVAKRARSAVGRVRRRHARPQPEESFPAPPAVGVMLFNPPMPRGLERQRR